MVEVKLKQYKIIRFALLLTGIILYFAKYFNIVLCLPYVSFLFGSPYFYMLSPFIPIVLCAGYLFSYFSKNDIPILVLLTIFDVFSFPAGTIFAFLFIGYLIYTKKIEITKKQLVAIFIPFILALPLAYYIVMPQKPHYTNPSTLSFEKGRGEYIIKLKDLPSSQSIEAQSVVAQQITTLGGNVVESMIHPVNTILAEIDSSKIPQLLNNNYVDSVYPNEKAVRIFDVYTLNNVNSLLSLNLIPSNGSGIVIAVVDTGINENIPQLKRNGRSVVIDKYELYGDYVYPHGTEVACCIASQNPDYPGVARGVDLLDVEVFQNDGMATYWDILKGWNWVANWKMAHNRYVICSNSFGCPPQSSASILLNEALDNMVLKYGIPMIVASGNSGGAVMSPGNAEYAFTVGAVDKMNMIASFSCYGKELDVVAYGVNINTFDEHGNLRTVSGTSFSTPIVAGCFALVAEKTKLQPLEMYNLFRTTAKDLGTSGFDNQYGYGLIDPVTAYSTVTNQYIPQTDIEPVVILALIPSILGVIFVNRKELEVKI